MTQRFTFWTPSYKGRRILSLVDAVQPEAVTQCIRKGPNFTLPCWQWTELITRPAREREITRRQSCCLHVKVAQFLGEESARGIAKKETSVELRVFWFFLSHCCPFISSAPGGVYFLLLCTLVEIVNADERKPCYLDVPGSHLLGLFLGSSQCAQLVRDVFWETMGSQC